MKAIEVSGVRKQFGDIQAIRKVSLDIMSAEIVGVIGPDGAGKTTLFRIISSLLLPDEGSVSMLGIDVVKDYRKIRNIIGYMPGRFSLYYDLTVGENLNFYARVFGTDVMANYDLIKPVFHQLKPFKNRRAGALSGGMKQKLALSCALIHRPKVLILDEPTTGVDAVSRKEFWDLLHEIRENNISILVSTPYMDEATRCDRVALMQKGSILTVNKPERIPEEFNRDLYSVVAGKSNFQLLRELRSKAFIHSAWLFGQDIHVSPDKRGNASQELKDYLASKDDLLRYEKIKPGIEDTFMELMKKE